MSPLQPTRYGEDSKLIYDLQDQGGEICSLRYDLTVSCLLHYIHGRTRANILSVFLLIANSSLFFSCTLGPAPTGPIRTVPRNEPTPLPVNETVPHRKSVSS
jgi:hypothetical protein